MDWIAWGIPIGLLSMGLGIRWLLAPLQRRSRAARREAWKAAAHELGIAFGEGHLQGIVSGFDVDVVIDSGENEGTRIAVGSGTRRISFDLCLEKEGLRAAIDKARGGQDILVHDARFDGQVRVRGDELQVVALLDGLTRDLIFRELVRGTAVRHGEVRWCTAGAISDTAILVGRVRDLVQLAEALSPDPIQVPERLARNAVSDRDVHVRMRNLELLLGHCGDTEVARKACRDLLRSGDFLILRCDDAGLRLRAAKLLGTEAIDALKSLIVDDYNNVGLRCDALLHLATLPSPDAVPVLEAKLLSSVLPLRLAAVRAMGKRRYGPAFERLRSMLQTEQGEVGAAIVLSLEQIGGPAAEPTCIDSLGHEDTAVRVAAAQVLGRIGTIAAVEPLLACTKGVLVSPDLKQAARAAIDEIQTRLGNVEEGRLSLAESSRGGALSLATEAGKLAIAGPAPPGDVANGSKDGGKSEPTLRPYQEDPGSSATGALPASGSGPPAQVRPEGEARA